MFLNIPMFFYHSSNLEQKLKCCKFELFSPPESSQGEPEDGSEGREGD
jgi:hypothetical protein